jgi:hypothetical protein
MRVAIKNVIGPVQWLLLVVRSVLWGRLSDDKRGARYDIDNKQCILN